MSNKMLIQIGDTKALDERGIEYHYGVVLTGTICEYCDETIDKGKHSWECQTSGDEGWESVCVECVELISTERCISLYAGKKAEHLSRHIELHEHLDELIADWIDSENRPSLQYRVIDLMRWSAMQSKSPDHPYKQNC